MATEIIENLITKLSFKYDDKNLKGFDKTITSIAKTMVGIVAAASAAQTAIYAFTQKVAEANDKTGKFSQRIGVDVKALQELGYVAELNGGSIDSMNSSLESLSKIISEASRGIGSGVEVFGMLGLSAIDSTGKLKSADSMLLEISDSISKLSTQAEKLEFAGKLGISPDLLLAIENGSQAIIEQRKEAQALGFAFGKDAAQAAAVFNDEMLRVTKIIKGVTSQIGTKLMKQLTPMIKTFTEWFKINQKIISQKLTDSLQFLMNVINGVFNVTVRVFNTLSGLVDIFGGLENVIKIATVALIALNASALFIPVVMAGIAAAIFLLIEDIVKFAQGGDSAIGDLINRFPALEAPIRGLINLMKMVGEGWSLIFTQGEEAFEGLIMMIKDFGEYIYDLVLIPINKTIDLLNKIPGLSISNVGAPQIGSPVPIASAGAGGISNLTNNNVTNTSKPNININVNGGNAAEVRKTIDDVLNEQYAGAVTNLSSEVDF